MAEEDRIREEEELERIRLEKEQIKALRRNQGYGRPSTKKHHTLIIFLVIGFLLVIFFVVVPMFAEAFFSTYAGEQTQAGVTETKAGFTNIFRPAKGYLSNLWQTITIGPTQQWDAQELHSDLLMNEDAGVAVRDLGALIDFSVGDNIVIAGELDAISTFQGRKVVLTLGVDPAETDDELDYGWNCELFNEEGKNTFEVGNINSRRFTCIHPALKNPGTYSLTFRLKYRTQAVVWKNLFVTDTNAFLLYENPAEFFEIKPEETVAYVASDGKTIDLSMGLARVSKKDFLDTIFTVDNPEDAFIPAVSGDHSSVHDQYLGVALRSKGFSNDLYIYDLFLTLPKDPAIHYIERGSQSSSPQEVIGKEYPELITYSVPRKYLKTLPAGESEVYYLKFYVDDNYLGDSQYRTLTAQAEIDYDYIYKETITINVRELSGQILDVEELQEQRLEN